MTEQLISPETAKLAKEKGFSVGSQNYYNLRYGDLRTVGEGKSSFDDQARPSNENNIYAIAEAPTQSLLQKWLRDKHKLSVEVYYIGPNNWGYGVYTIEEASFEVRGCGDSATYEEALEAGLKECLELL